MEYPEELCGGKISQAERTEDGECFGGGGSVCLGGKSGIFVECFCCLLVCTLARFEDVTLTE